MATVTVGECLACCTGFDCDECYSAAPTQVQLKILTWPLAATSVPDQRNTCACPGVVGTYNISVAQVSASVHEGGYSVSLGTCDGTDYFLRLTAQVQCHTSGTCWRGLAAITILRDDPDPLVGVEVVSLQWSTVSCRPPGGLSCPSLNHCPVTWPYACLNKTVSLGSQSENSKMCHPASPFTATADITVS